MDLRKISLRIAGNPNIPGPIGKAVQIAEHLGNYLYLRYASEIAYRNHADRLRGPWRDSVVEHWSHHAEEQRAMIYDLSMKMMTLGMDPAFNGQVYMPSESDLMSLLNHLESHARQLLEIGQNLLGIEGIGTEFRVLIENQMLTDSQHLSDVLRMKPEGRESTT